MGSALIGAGCFLWLLVVFACAEVAKSGGYKAGDVAFGFAAISALVCGPFWIFGLLLRFAP